MYQNWNQWGQVSSPAVQPVVQPAQQVAYVGGVQPMYVQQTGVPAAVPAAGAQAWGQVSAAQPPLPTEQYQPPAPPPPSEDKPPLPPDPPPPSDPEPRPPAPPEEVWSIHAIIESN